MMMILLLLRLALGTRKCGGVLTVLFYARCEALYGTDAETAHLNWVVGGEKM